MQPSSANRSSTVRKAILIACALLAAVAVLIGWFLCFPVFVQPSGSMEKTVLLGDRFIVDRVSTMLGRRLQYGDVIAFRYPPNPQEDYLKRVVGMPGDRLRLRDKRLYRNGLEVQEPYAQHVTSYVDAYRDNFPNGKLPAMGLSGEERAAAMIEHHVHDGELVIPAGKYFVMGDNRDDSADSRYWGFIQRSDVIGRAVVIYGSSDASRIWKRVN